MSRSESVPTSRRLRLRGQQRPNDLDDTALDELAACFVDVDEDSTVDAVELAFDHDDIESTIDALRRLADADYDVRVRELVVEIRR